MSYCGFRIADCGLRRTGCGVRTLSGGKEIPMNERKLFIIFMWVAIGGALFSLYGLVASGAGDHPSTFQTCWLGSAIVLGSSLIALALLRGRKD
jgi:hypothetical protein